MRSLNLSNVTQTRTDRFPERRQRAGSSGTSSAFVGQLDSAVKQSGSTAASVAASATQRQIVATSSSTRQNSVASSPVTSSDTAGQSSNSGQTVFMTPFGPHVVGAVPVTPKPAAAPAAASTDTAAAAAAAAQAEPLPVRAMNVLSEELRKSYMDPAGLNLTYEETEVPYPGGSYTNRCITLELGNGKKESYDVNLMMKNPWLTVFEMRRFMSFYAQNA